jgi:hypothetical protein
MDDVVTPVAAQQVSPLVHTRLVFDVSMLDTVLGIAAIDADGSWAFDGAVSMASAVRAAGFGRAHWMVKLARTVVHWPLTQEAVRDGRMTWDQLETLVAVLHRHAARFADDEAELLGVMSMLRGRQLIAAAKHWLSHVDPDGPMPDPFAQRTVSVSAVGEMTAITGTLDPVSGDIVHRAVARAVTPDGDGEERSAGQRRADALVDICSHFLSCVDVTAHEGRAERPVLVLVSTPDQLREGRAQMLDGLAVPAPDVRAASCDCAVQHLVIDRNGVPLHLGRAQRLASQAQFTAIAVRDRSCRFPGCDRPVAWCDAHHVHEWEAGGTTCVTNLLCLCRRHHRLVHTPGWELTYDPAENVVRVITPDGRALIGPAPPLLVRIE